MHTEHARASEQIDVTKLGFYLFDIYSEYPRFLYFTFDYELGDFNLWLKKKSICPLFKVFKGSIQISLNSMRKCKVCSIK